MKSIDVRTVAVCFSPEMGWENLVTSIIISDKTVEEIKTMHKQLPTIRNNYIVMLYEAQPFNFQIFEDMAKGELKFLTVYGYNKVQTRTSEFGNLKVESKKDQTKRTPQIFLKTHDQGDLKKRKKLWDTVYGQQNLPNQFGFSRFQEMVKHCLKLEEYDHNVQKDLEITIIPPAKLETVQISGKKVSVKIHNSHKIKNLQLNFDLRNHQEDVWITPAKIDEDTNSIELEINEMLPLDILNVKLIHNKTGLRLDETDVNVPLEHVVEPFLKTFDAFCSLDDFQKMLFEPQKYGKNPTKIFENAVTWLLSFAGYESLNIGVVIKNLDNRGEKRFDKIDTNGYHVGSADIIAYEENDRLLLIDCDINTVDPKKVEKLAELGKYIKEKITCQKLKIVPLLFTPTNFTRISPSTDVMIVDKAIIKRILEAVVKGNRKHARSCLRYVGV